MQAPLQTTILMRILKLFVLLIAFVSWGTARAQNSGFGLGLVIGDPTGVSWKAWLSGDRALQGAVAWSLGGHGAFQTHVDYLFHDNDLIHVNKGRMSLYYGPGARIRVWGDDRHWHGGRWHDSDSRLDLAARIPVGLDYGSAGAPIDVFFEIAPVLALVPSTYFDFDFGLGARFWFR